MDIENELSVHTHYSEADDYDGVWGYMGYVTSKAKRLGVRGLLGLNLHHDNDIIGGIMYRTMLILPGEVVISNNPDGIKSVTHGGNTYRRATRVECVLAALDVHLWRRSNPRSE